MSGTPDADSVGNRLRYLRGRRGWTQTQLAVRSGLSISFISRIESGQRRILRRYDLYALADALQVAPIELTGRAESAEDPLRQQSYAAALLLRRALLAPQEDVPVRPVAEVAPDVTAVLQARLAADLNTMARRLPGLLDECRAGVQLAADERELRGRLRLLATVQHMALILGKGLSLPDLAALASQQFQQVSAQLEAPLWQVAEATQRAMLWSTINLRQQALPLALATVDRVDALLDGKPASTEVAGMAHIAAATAAAAMRRTDLAAEHIAESRRLGAAITTGSTPCGLVYSRDVVGTWAVWCATEAGEPGRIPQLIRTIDIAALPDERRASLYLDAARGLASVRREANRAAAALRMAEAASPQRVRAHSLARETIAALLPAVRDGEHREYLTGLASRCGMPV